MRRIVETSLGGAAWGGLLLAGMVAVACWFDTSGGFLGSNRTWWIFVAAPGAVVGVVGGLLIGGIVGATRIRRLASMGVGTGAGVLVSWTAIAALSPPNRLADWLLVLTPIPWGALTGYLIATRSQAPSPPV